jgi:hypothetical protein
MKQGQTVKAMVEVKIVNVLVLRNLGETVFLLKRGGDIVPRVLPSKIHMDLHTRYRFFLDRRVIVTIWVYWG